ncbi:hypothetical protein A2U01_0074550, partial [Trifolium medium]|nr:hypothetical protein [Trifolium medium]
GFEIIELVVDVEHCLQVGELSSQINDPLN